MRTSFVSTYRPKLHAVSWLFQKISEAQSFAYSVSNGHPYNIFSHRRTYRDSLREKERKINRDLEDGIKAAVENKATLNDLFKLYMANKPELKDTTRSNYLYMYNKYVKDAIGKKKIASIKYSDVKAFYNKLIREKGFKPNSMEIIHTIIHPVFTLAVRDNYIRTNPATGAMAEIKKSHNWEKPKRHALTNGAEDEGSFGFCSKTLDLRFRKDGGRAWYAVLKTSEDGGEPYWGREYVEVV